MLKNYFKIFIRSVQKQKGYAFINLTGLALGMTLFILIMLYIQFEFSFDKFNKYYDRICRVELNFDGKGKLIAFSHTPLGPILVKDYAEILKCVRFLNMGNEQLLTYGKDKKFYENRGWWAENTFFEIFSYRLLQGDRQNALREPFSIVLTQDLADKYFPGEDALGKVMNFNNMFDCEVTGIIENCPANSHIQYNYLISYTSYKMIGGADYLDNWGRIANYTYVLLAKHATVEKMNTKIQDVLKTYWRDDIDMPVYLKPLSKFHFHSNVIGEVGSTGEMNRIFMFLAIGVFILLIACVNFMNLSTARAARRTKEIGTRKVVGANRFALVKQFLGESILFSFCAIILAIMLSMMLIPEFNKIIGRELSINFIDNWYLPGGLLCLALIVGVISGSYPAFVLSSFKPIKILQGSGYKNSGNSILRKILVIFQFSISIILIVGTVIIYKQMHFMKTKELGIDKEHIIVTQFRRMDQKTTLKYDALKAELLKNPSVSHIAVSRHIPSFNGSSIVILGWDGSTEEDKAFVNINYVDVDYLDTYGIELISGRNFSPVTNVDTMMYSIINETAAKRFGWEPATAIGKRLGGNIQVLGVVKDYHFASLRHLIQPMVLMPLGEPPPGSRARNHFSIKISPANMKENINFVQSKFQQIFPDDVFDYWFFDEDFDRMYQVEERTAKTVGYFSIAAIIIACLGLYGLASFSIEQRTKEIGVRKVLGAAVSGIIMLLSKEFTKWIILANLIAWPIAYFVLNKWIQNFSYRTDINFWPFILSGFVALIIAFFTVIYQSFRAALMNPVNSLKYE